MPVNKSRVLHVEREVKQVSVGNPEIADILVLESKQLYVLGKSIGGTNVVIWDNENRVIKTIDVDVTHDLESLKRTLHDLLPNENIGVRSSQQSIVLSGQVGSPASVQAAVDLAEGYLGKDSGSGEGGGKGAKGKVINTLQVGGAQQVMLKVQVAEIARSFTKKLNINFNAFGSNGGWGIGAVNGGAKFPDALIDVPQFDPNTGEFKEFVTRRVPLLGTGESLGPHVTEIAPTPLAIEDKGLYLSYLGSDFLFRMVIEAAKSKGLAKILAEPNLTVMSGQEATFLSGGEYPIPVSTGDGEVSVEYKDFGIGLKFLPVVLGSGQISLKVNVSVSEIKTEESATIAVSGTSSAFFIPALTKRSAVSTVELTNGQTMGIAGLINENLREQVSRFPGLGDLPILGMLFRSQEYIKGQTELVIFVTPYFAQATQRQNLTMPTDAFVEPNDAEFYLMGRTVGDPPPKPGVKKPAGSGASERTPSGGGTMGAFGHDL